MIKKILKITGISLLLIIIALIILPFVFKDKILRMVKDEINNTLNAKVDFSGFDIGVFSTFPDLYVELNQLSVIGINEFEKDTLLNVPIFTVNVNLLSVFSDQIKIKSINIEKPNIKLIVLKDGKANWDIVKESSDTITETDTTKSNFLLKLKKLSIKNAKFSYLDESSNMFFSSNNTNFLLKGDLSAEKTVLKTELSLDTTTFNYEGISFLRNGNIQLTSEIDADLKNYVFTFTQNQFIVNQFKLIADGSIAMPDEDINIDISYKAEKTDFKTLLSLIPAIYMKDFESIKTNGNISFEGTIKGTYNEKQLPGFMLNLKVDKGSFQYPNLPSSVNNIFIDLAINNKDGIPDNTVIDLKKFHAEIANNPIDAQLLVSTPVSNANLKGIIKGKLDLSQISSFYPLPNTTLKGLAEVDVLYQTSMNQVEQEKYEEIQAKGYIKLSNLEYFSLDLPQATYITSLETEITPKYFDLKKIEMKIGQSDMSLKGKIENFMAYLFKDQLLKGDFTLYSNVLNINQFLSSNETNTSTSETSSSDSAVIEAPSIPQNIDFTFKSQIKQLFYDNMDISNMQGQITIKEGVLSLENLQFNALDGLFNLKAQYSYTGTLPNATFTFNLKNLDIKKTYETFTIIKQMVPVAERCQGKISINFDMATQLSKNLSPVLNNVQAKGTLSAPYIIVENSELGKKLSEFFRNNQYKSFKVEQVAISFEIKDGNIIVEPVKTKIGNIQTEFYGNQNLDQRLNYNLLMNVSKTTLGSQANEIFGQWAGTAQQAGINIKVPDVIPVIGLIKGTITKPEIKFNLKDMAQQSIETVKEAIKEKISEEVDKAKEEAIRKAQQEAERLMREAEQKANQIISAAEAAAKQINESSRQAANQIRQEANDKATQIEKEGKSKGPIAEKIAKESAEKIRKEAEKKASEIENKAQQESQAKINQARAEAQQIKAAAKLQGDKLIEEAKKK